MVFRILISVTLLMLSCKCFSLFLGETCLAENRNGSCQLLRDCEPLMADIRLAGSPLPRELSRRLNELNCGFMNNEPMVCCNEPLINTNRPSTSPHYDGTDHNNPDHDIHVPVWGRPTHNEEPVETTTKRRRPTWGISGDDDDQLGNHHGNDDDDDLHSGSPPDIRGHKNLGLLPTNCGVIDEDRIIGGNRTGLFEMPWMVLIAYNSPHGTKLNCAGTLINQWYVMTAAHCVTSLGSKLTLSGVVLGEHDIRSDPDCERVEGVLQCAPKSRNMTIERVLPHPGYNPSKLFDDIALIRLSEAADFTLENMKPICLPITPELQAAELVGLNAVVAGWGTTEEGLQSPILLSVQLPVISNKDCQDYFKGHPRIYDRQICAGGMNMMDSCSGDSGGPLLYPGLVGSHGVSYVQRGIVSFGSKKCGIAGYPGIYTRVSHYMDWILDNITE